MTWSQKYFLRLFQWDLANSRRNNIGTVWKVPAGIEVEDLTKIFVELMGWCESLRTTYDLSDGQSRQIAQESGELVVSLRETSLDDAEACADRLSEELLDYEFDISHEMPIRLGIVKADESVRYLVASYCHMAVDGTSLRIIQRLVEERLAGNRDVGLEERVAGAEQPIDRALVEQSAHGKNMSERALNFWHDSFRELPEIMYDGQGPAESCTEQAWLHSHIAARAVQDIAENFRTTSSTVLLGGLAIVTSVALGVPEVAVQSLFSVRYGAARKFSIGCMIQNGLFRTDVRDGNVRDFFGQATAAFLKSARHNQYDPDDLDRALGIDRSGRPNQFIIFNNLGADSFNGVGKWREEDCSGETRCELEDHSAYAKGIKLSLMAFNLVDAADLWLFVDRRYFPAGAISILRSLERILDMTARNPELTVSDLVRACQQSDRH